MLIAPVWPGTCMNFDALVCITHPTGFFSYPCRPLVYIVNLKMNDYDAIIPTIFHSFYEHISPA